MAGLVPAIHVARRSGGSQASEKGEKLCVCILLLLGAPASDSSLKRRGVDGRDKPGHDGGGSGGAIGKGWPTADAISADILFLIARSRVTLPLSTAKSPIGVEGGNHG